MKERSVKIAVLHEIRCKKCGRKLAEMQGIVQIKCPKCGHLATYRI
nr:MAG TPA: DNA-directed RNA polymerase II subunit [Caudoviricetes sp.]